MQLSVRDREKNIYTKRGRERERRREREREREKEREVEKYT